MPGESGIFFDKERCIQCHGCETACKSWRHVEPGVAWRRIDRAWYGRYPDIKLFPVCIACLHCDEPACAGACPEQAITKRAEDGVVVVDREACTGCGACFDACPFDVPQFGADGKMQKCDLCMIAGAARFAVPPCVATCPTHALVFHG
jgi:anaerobic dimethyl sulfoxide reductase subunit B